MMIHDAEALESPEHRSSVAWRTDARWVTASAALARPLLTDAERERERERY